MSNQDQIIGDAVARYDRERDRYLKLAARVADVCRTDIVETNAVRAQVTSRAKSVRSFELKLQRIVKQKKKVFSSVDDVFMKIGDLSGVRIAAYQPEDEERITEEIRKRFLGPKNGSVDVDPKDRIGQGGFYRSTHCQVFLPEEDLVGTYENLKGTGCEIQVCSMMAHVWNEIEHDIGYKPEGGGPGDVEKGLLNALGFLTRSGDEVITRLLEANVMRLQNQTGDFNDVYDFIARLREDFPAEHFHLNAGQLFDELQSLRLTSPEKLRKAAGAEYDLQRSRALIEAFNAYAATGTNSNDFRMDAETSDVVLAAILPAFWEKVVANHPVGRGMGRPPRIRSIAVRYGNSLKGEASQKVQADENAGASA